MPAVSHRALVCFWGVSGRIEEVQPPWGWFSIPIKDSTWLHVFKETANPQNNQNYSHLCKSTFRTGEGISNRFAINYSSSCISLLCHSGTTQAQMHLFRIFHEFGKRSVFWECHKFPCWAWIWGLRRAVGGAPAST